MTLPRMTILNLVAANKWLALNGLVLLAILAHSIYRDIQLERQFPTDLRNRVVGARLQKDGLLPYHYHWQPSDGVRYYNPDEDAWLPDGRIPNDIRSRNADINKITASPFFHELLSPICDLPQRTLSRIWFWSQYLMLFAMICMIIRLSGKKEKQWIVLNMGILFTTTEAWKSSISTGQLYFFLSFLMCCILTGLVNHKKLGMILAGICAAALVLTRPFSIVFFLPLVFYFKDYLVFLGTSAGIVVTYLLYIIINPAENALYRDYLNAMQMQVQLHQAATGTLPIHAAPVSSYTKIEGFDLQEVTRLTTKDPIPVYSENGNVFVLYYKIFHKKIPLFLLYTILSLTLVSLSLLFLVRNRKQPVRNLEILLFGFTLFMIVELFSPVFRRQYNTVLWFPLVLAAFLLLPEKKNVVFFILLAGLALNILNFNWLPLRHTLGEYLWLTGLLWLILLPPPRRDQADPSPLHADLLLLRSF